MLILILLWMFEVVFLKQFYQQMKRDEITALGDSLAQSYDQSEDYVNKLHSAAFDNNVAIVLFNSSYKVDFSTSAFGQFSFAFDIDKIKGWFSRTVEEGHTRFTYIDDSLPDRSTLLYGAVLSDDLQGQQYYLYMASPLAAVETATEVIRNQLTIVTLSSLVLAFIISWIFSSRLSGPITNMSLAAKRLAKGDYSVQFEGNGFNEIDELSETLNYATRELKKTDELRRDLIANVSHDLRTPLTMIKAYAEMIRDLSGEDPVKRAKHTQIIIDETDRLSALVNDYLNLAKMQSGTEELVKQPFDLSALTETAISHFDYLAESQGYVFHTDITEGVIVDGDARKIEQVVYNLISNAVNYTGDDKSVTVTLHSYGKFAELAVIDTGKGIPDEEKDGIFERYYRTGKTHKRQVVGTGLGLAIVKGILIKHDVAFGVQSEVGHGSRFWFRMPIVHTKKKGSDEK
ncbi:MAG: HAMP domain-containing protein [Clostridia bacterium]|nr:HAMP domain-containing protein [Clostridia bacterium]